MIYVVMGVAGCGKTTVGMALAERLGGEFLDADPYHPPANVAKMSRGIPLSDEDEALRDREAPRGPVLLGKDLDVVARAAGAFPLPAFDFPTSLPR
jgi:shikimate kinase